MYRGPNTASVNLVLLAGTSDQSEILTEQIQIQIKSNKNPRQDEF